MLPAAVFLSLSMSVVPAEYVAEDHVDWVEYNWLHDAEGKKIFGQIVYWEQGEDGQDNVVSWRLWKQDSQIPAYDPRQGLWKAIWWDSSACCLRRITSASKEHTWTQHDPELENRCGWPKERRRGLRWERGQ
jgi:hypothetical protein